MVSAPGMETDLLNDFSDKVGLLELNSAMLINFVP
jgi:hypothetical protein